MGQSDSTMYDDSVWHMLSNHMEDFGGNRVQCWMVEDLIEGCTKCDQVGDEMGKGSRIQNFLLSIARSLFLLETRALIW